MGLFGKKKTPEEKLDELYEKGMAVFHDGNYSKALTLFEKAAEQGHANAQNYCGAMYYKGDGTAKDEKKAFYWYEKAAEQGNAVAQNNCGVMYENGYGTAEDDTKAFYWYEKAAEQGNADAMKNLGNLYFDGKGTEADMEKALLWSERAAEQGNAIAQGNCGFMYKSGIGTEKDEEKAFYWYEKAAEQGVELSQYNCGIMCEKGIGTLMDEEKALYWYKKAVEQGNSEAQSAYEKLREIRSTLIDKLAQAEQAFFEGEYEEAISCYEWVLAHTDDYDFCDQACEGLAQAKKRMKESEQFWRSVRSEAETPAENPVNEMSAEDTYQKGMELYQAGDYTKALSLFEKAAEQGNIDAQYNCGKMYEKGTGTQRDGKKAFYWYEKAAEQGHADAQYGCGFLYRYGYSGFRAETDKKKAFYWYEKAAKQGNIYAQYDYGEMYEKGIGTEKDVKKAFYWYEKAAEQGHEVAQYNCGLMYESGCGTAVDTDKAFQWYEKAAKQGHTEAQEKIEAEGERCFFAEDYKKAASLLSIAAEADRQGAFYLLGRMYVDGLGVQKDSTKAKELFDKLPSTSIDERYTITFGTYPQGEHDEIGPIRWYVLDRRDDRLLLLSAKVLDARAYHGSREPITWEKCDLRQWLNHAFMEKAFTEKEKDELIEEVRLENPDNTEYGTPGGSATTDKVFLLSMEDARKYLNIDADDEDDRDSKTMEGKYTPYVGKKIGEYECFGNAYWWLRSPGAKRETAADMEHNYGFLEDKGMNVDFPYCGIRPALWLKLKP